MVESGWSRPWIRNYDGITESESPDGDLFGLERLQKILQAAAGDKAEQLVRVVVDASAAFTGAGPKAEDITVLGVRWLGACSYYA